MSKVFWLGAALMLAGCGGPQTSSGADYIASRPEFRPAPGNTVERAVFDAANVEPNLRFPARFGLARLQGGSLTNIPSEEAAAWLALAAKAGRSYGTFVPISPLIASMADSAESGTERYSGVDRICIAAARQHVDAVLIYEATGQATDKVTALSVLDLTIVGAFLIPTRAVGGQAKAYALLVDVRNGYPYGTATSRRRNRASPSTTAPATVPARYCPGRDGGGGEGHGGCRHDDDDVEIRAGYAGTAAAACGEGGFPRAGPACAPHASPLLIYPA